MSIYQLLRYSVPFLIDSISNGFMLITIYELKPWVFLAFKLMRDCSDLSIGPQTSCLTFDLP